MFDYISDKLRLVAKILMILAWILSAIILIGFVSLAIEEESGTLFLIGTISAISYWFMSYISALLLHANATSLEILSRLGSNMANISTTTKSSEELLKEQIEIQKTQNLTNLTILKHLKQVNKSDSISDD